MHIDADAFFASVEKGQNPKLSGKPVIVGGLPHQRGCVHTASYEARRKGIYTGMSLRQAKELCPEAVFLKGDLRKYRAAGITIKNILMQYSPEVEFASVDDAYIDLAKASRLFNKVEGVAEEIRQKVKEQVNIGVSIGIAASKLVARIASGLNKPDGITAVPAGQEEQFLAVLPLRQLRGIGRKTERSFHDLGVTTIGGLAELPKMTVMQLLGAVTGETIWRYAHGIDTRKIQNRILPTQISRETSFEEDTDDEYLIRGTMRYLTERIAVKLRQNSWNTRRLSLKIYYADKVFKKQAVTLKNRTNDGELLGKHAESIYHIFANRRVRVRLIGIKVMDIKNTLEQRSLFELNCRQDDLNRSVDKVRSRFGFTSVNAGNTLILQNYYRMEKHGFILHTPSLSQ